MPQDIFDRVAETGPSPAGGDIFDRVAATPQKQASLADAFAGGVLRTAVTPETAEGAVAGLKEGFAEGRTYLRELLLGPVEGAGIDPAKPVRSAASNVLNFGKDLLSWYAEAIPATETQAAGLGPGPSEPHPIADPILDAGKQNFAEAQRRYEQGDVAGAAVYATSAAVPIIGPAATRIGNEIRESLDSGDNKRLANSVGQGMGFIGTLALASPEAQALLKSGASAAVVPTANTVGRVASTAKQGAVTTARAVRHPVETIATAAGLGPNSLFTRALKPRSTNVRFEVDLDRALPEIKISESTLGRPIQGLDDLSEAVGVAKKRVRAQYDEIAGPQRMAQIDGILIAEAIEGSISRKLRFQNPERAAAIAESANQYRRTFQLDELEDFLKTTNAELQAYYGKYPATQRSARADNPDTAQLVAEGEGLRRTIYGALGDTPGNSAAREIQRRYGSLMNLEREVFRRRNVALRQQAESLTEQLGKVAAALETGKALIQGTVGLDPAGAMVRIGGAMGARRMAQAIKARNTADAYITRAMEGYTRTPEAVTPGAPPPAAIRSPGVPIPKTSNPLYNSIVDDSVNTRMRNVAETYREMAVNAPTGRARGAKSQIEASRLNAGYEALEGRFGGYKDAFPELKDFPEAPARMAEAIERGNGALYDRIRQAVRRLVVEEEGADILRFIEDDPFE